MYRIQVRRNILGIFQDCLLIRAPEFICFCVGTRIVVVANFYVQIITVYDSTRSRFFCKKKISNKDFLQAIFLNLYFGGRQKKSFSFPSKGEGRDLTREGAEKT